MVGNAKMAGIDSLDSFLVPPSFHRVQDLGRLTSAVPPCHRATVPQTSRGPSEREWRRTTCPLTVGLFVEYFLHNGHNLLYEIAKMAVSTELCTFVSVVSMHLSLSS
jgi:hypothetical protein